MQPRDQIAVASAPKLNLEARLAAPGPTFRAAGEARLWSRG